MWRSSAGLPVERRQGLARHAFAPIVGAQSCGQRDRGAAGYGARFVSVGEKHCEAVDARRRPRAHLRRGPHRGDMRRRAARRRALCGRRRVRRQAVPHRRDARPHLQGAHRPRVRGGGDARRPAHHQRLARDGRVKVWSVASKSLVGDCIGHNSGVTRGGGDARRQAHPQRLGRQDCIRRWLLDGTQTDTFRLHTASVRALVALPDNQHALSGSNDTPSSSSTPTTAPSCAPSSTTYSGALPRAAARRPSLRQRLGRPHRLHRRARPRAALEFKTPPNLCNPTHRPRRSSRRSPSAPCRPASRAC